MGGLYVGRTLSAQLLLCLGTYRRHNVVGVEGERAIFIFYLTLTLDDFISQGKGILQA